jgi:hypothetical protein
MHLRGERVALRPLVADDLGAVYAALQEPAVARWWGAFDADRIREELLESPVSTSSWPRPTRIRGTGARRFVCSRAICSASAAIIA